VILRQDPLRRSFLAESQALRHLKKHINVIIHAPKKFLARPHREHGYVRQTMHPLRALLRHRALPPDPLRPVLNAWLPRPLHIDGPVLAVVRERDHALLQRVPRLPRRGEVRALRVGEVSRGDILRQAGAFVEADGVALGAVGGLGVDVFRVDAAGYVEAVALMGG
jgi:hypothetical protein